MKRFWGGEWRLPQPPTPNPGFRRIGKIEENSHKHCRPHTVARWYWRCLHRFGATDTHAGGWLFLIAVAMLAVAVTFLRKIYPVWRRSEAYRALRLADVDNMSGEQFERYVNELLKAQGYKTKMTPARNDYGVDIVAERGGVSYAVQCKRYGENISRGAVSDAVAGKHYYNCSQSMVVTNRHFRRGALELAGASQCALIDRDTLAGWIQNFQVAQTTSSMTSEKARSLMTRLAVGSAACIVILIAIHLAFPARQMPAPPPPRKAVAKPVAAGATKAPTPAQAVEAGEAESRRLIEEEMRLIEQGEDESQKPPEQRRPKEAARAK